MATPRVTPAISAIAAAASLAPAADPGERALLGEQRDQRPRVGHRDAVE